MKKVSMPAFPDAPRKLRRRSRPRADPDARAVPTSRARMKRKEARAVAKLWAARLKEWEKRGETDPDWKRQARVLRALLADKAFDADFSFWAAKLQVAMTADDRRAEGDAKASWRDYLRDEPETAQPEIQG